MLKDFAEKADVLVTGTVASPPARCSVSESLSNSSSIIVSIAVLFPPPHAMIAIINKKNCIYFEKISNLDIKNSSIFSVLARKNESS
jgi:hypothetical protein